jgi:hypothetical protein
MVFRLCASSTRAVPGRRSPSFAPCFMAGALLVAAVAAQTPAAAPPPAGQDPAPPAAAPVFGRVVADQAPLRCWPSAVAQPPVFEESLAKDQVVALGRSENGFRAVVLPLGPLGFVSKKFTESGAAGEVKTKGDKVAFRYRPRSSEAPVAQLPASTTLHVVGEHEDWFKVRVPGVDAWVAEAEVAMADAGDPEVAKAAGLLQQQHQAAVQARLDAIAAQRAREAQDQADLAAVQVVQDAFTAEMKKSLGEQDYAPLTSALDRLTESLAAESAGRPAIEALKKRMDTQRWIAEASALRDSKPPVTDAPLPEKKDQLERFRSIGWLRYERRLAGPGIYYLEKGGQRQYLVQCSNSRYDLALFVDYEVGVNGPRRRPVTESLSVIDVERLEVLGAPSK